MSVASTCDRRWPRRRDLLPVAADRDVQAAVAAFIAGRLEVVLRDRGLSAHVVKAILAEQAHDPYAAALAAHELATATAAADWPPLLDAYARCVRITRGEPPAYALRPDAYCASRRARAPRRLSGRC